MTDRYTDENGQPRFGVRVSPEELERIRREQGIEPPPAAPTSPSPEGGDGAAPGRASSSTGQEQASTYPAGRTESGLAAPPPGGWSWQRGPGASGRTGRRRTAPPAAYPQAGQQAPGGAPGQPWGQGAAQPGPGSDGSAWPSQGYSSVYATGAPAQGRARGHRWRTLVIGLVLLVLVPGALTVGAVSSAVDGSLSSGGVLTSKGEVYLDDGAHVGLYATGTSTAVAQCMATAPSGASVAVVPLDKELEAELGSAGGADAQAASGLPYASLTATETGTYTISCPGGTQGVVVGPALNVGKAVRAGWLMMGAFACGFVGLVTTVVGIVRAVRRA